jgi:hypothetical protein
MDRRNSFGKRGKEQRAEAPRVQKQAPQQAREAPKPKQEPRISIIRDDLGSPSFWDALKRIFRISE